MSVRNLENQGSGNILEITKERLLQIAPTVYPLTWQTMLAGSGEYAVILGAGFAEREVFFGLDDTDLSQYQLPAIHCYDIAPEPPPKFWLRRSQYQQVSIEYFKERDLNTLELPKLYANNMRLVSMHGVLDYLPPQSVVRLLSQVVALQPQALSIRLILIGNPWSRCFATSQQIETEQLSLKRLLANQLNPVDAVVFAHKGIIQLDISLPDKLKHNLLPSYGASHILPDFLAGYLINEGYKVQAVDKYSLTPEDLQGEVMPDSASLSNSILDYPHALLMFLSK